MKTAFKILPQQGLENTNHLLIEIGWEGISFLYLSNDRQQLQGLLIYLFDKNCVASEIAKDLNHFFVKEKLPGFESCNISYNFSECTLIPNTHFSASLLPDILDSQFTKNKFVSNYSEHIPGMGITVAYRVDTEIEKQLLDHFPGAVFYHSFVSKVSHFLKKGDGLYCSFYQHTFRVILFNNGELQLATFFEYTTPADVAYLLLNICMQHELSAQEITLFLNGFIDQKSNLFDELYRYFLNIELDEDMHGVHSSEEISQYPVHFFSHLITLAS